MRSLLRTPLFTGGVIFTLGLALAAAITAITIVDRVLLRPLPLRDAAAIVSILESDGKTGQRLVSYPTFKDWQARVRGFEGLAWTRGTTVSLGETGKRERAVLSMVSPGFFGVAGITPIVGRAFGPDEERAAGGSVALISEQLWGAKYGREPSVVGKTIIVDGRPLTIIGVVSSAQRFPEWAEVWVPIEPLIPSSPELQNRFLHVDNRTIGRLARGTTLEAAQRELSAIQTELSAQAPDPTGDFPQVQVQSLRDSIIGQAAGALVALGTAMLLVLLLAGANVGGLVLLRMARRERDFVVRAALGAPLGVLVRQLLVESLTLSALAGVVGTGLATAVLGLVRATPSLGVPRSAELAIDGRVIALAFVISLVVGVVIGLLPTWRLRTTVASGTRMSRGAVTAGEGGRTLRAAVTAMQLGLALTLLVGAGLMLRSFGRMQQVDLGFVADERYAFDVFPPIPRYASEEAARSLYGRLIERVAVIPGVQGAAFVNHAPLGGAIPTRVVVPGVAPNEDGRDYALYKTASAAYVDVMGLRMAKGRWFTEAEVAAGTNGVVVNETVAHRYWPDSDPIGRSITVFRSSQARPRFGEAEPSTVIGVVADVRHQGPASPAPPEVYLPYTREAWGWGSIVVRSSTSQATLRRAVEQAMLEVEPDLPLGGVSGAGFRTMREGVEAFMAPRRMSAGLAAALAGVALLVASLGLYAVAAYSVSQRTAEFGVRMALGASPGQIVQRVLRDGGKVAVVGLVLGAVGAVAVGRVLASQLFETSTNDPVALVISSTALLVVLLVALWIPARRAARLDPTVALRAD